VDGRACGWQELTSEEFSVHTVNFASRPLIDLAVASQIGRHAAHPVARGHAHTPGKPTADFRMGPLAVEHGGGQRLARGWRIADGQRIAGV
jgi:hypothetical protein